MGVSVLRHRFTVDDYAIMMASGAIAPDARVELLDGEVVDMTPLGSRHGACVDRLNRLLVTQLGARAIVRVQGAIRLSLHSMPQPDATVLAEREDFYARANPGPDAVLLLVEVSDTSLETDRSVKLPLYARAGIREVWIVDLAAEAVETYREPRGDGYARSARARRGQTIRPAALDGVALAVDDILG